MNQSRLLWALLWKSSVSSGQLENFGPSSLRSLSSLCNKQLVWELHGVLELTNRARELALNSLMHSSRLVSSVEICYLATSFLEAKVPIETAIAFALRPIRPSPWFSCNNNSTVFKLKTKCFVNSCNWIDFVDVAVTCAPEVFVTLPFSWLYQNRRQNILRQRNLNWKANSID